MSPISKAVWRNPVVASGRLEFARGAIMMYGDDHGKRLAIRGPTGVLTLFFSVRNSITLINVPAIPTPIGTVNVRQRTATQSCTATMKNTTGTNPQFRKNITLQGIG